MLVILTLDTAGMLNAPMSFRRVVSIGSIQGRALQCTSGSRTITRKNTDVAGAPERRFPFQGL
jgi:hypothetical protein